MRPTSFPAAALLTLGLLPVGILGGILQTEGFSTCLPASVITVDQLDVTYNSGSQIVTFDLAGTSTKEEEVIVSLAISAYGNQVYSKSFDPCDPATKVEKMCPVPAGTFQASGSQAIPAQFASQIPSIAFSIPDFEGEVKLELKAKDTGSDIVCIQSGVTNGKSAQVKGATYVTAGIAGAALAMSSISALGAGAAGHGAASASISAHPGFGDVMGWFHVMATNGMLSVDYPSIYRSFTRNFAWSTGVIPWNSMQISIDNFRNHTGGNLTDNSFEFLFNSTVADKDGTTLKSAGVAKRTLDFLVDPGHIFPRDVSASVNGSGNATAASGSGDGGINHVVSGIQAYVEELSIPQANVFMTILLIFAIVIASIAAGILLCKVILEVWAMYGTFPEKLSNFRKDYWGLLARTITNLILIMYGMWTLYCVFQFTRGDSWAAKLLAAVTLAIFTAVLGFFSFRIWQIAHKYKKAEGDTSRLFEDQETWRKYSLFYDSYKKDYWWIFVPTIAYMFTRGCIIAAGDGHGLFQSAGQLIVEALMLILLVWSRPYEAKSARWINITIQAVRVLSVACVLVFVQELGISKTTKTVTGIVLIAIQSTLTGVLAILIAVNAVIGCIRENPHARRRREAEKLNRDFDDLTPLDARNSLLMDRPSTKHGLDDQGMNKFNYTGPYAPYRDSVPRSRHHATESTDRLINSEEVDVKHTRSSSRESRESRGRSPSPNAEKPAPYGVAL
ncbi:hypothetical protein DTO166G4_5271 [Paecilomyces variotii]|nr:hypothetical protein DTO166G4_5271 [Paecilomyces variotii]KAJ9234504.1 hypothetical protein DTO166G5_5101 [Paecilomyces variotii]KAJ9264972.1 hypothetical protein DTO195F2_1984 [Paecilomyces variotii]